MVIKFFYVAIVFAAEFVWNHGVRHFILKELRSRKSKMIVEIFDCSQAAGPSMEPTIPRCGAFLLIKRHALSYKKGDIVLARIKQKSGLSAVVVCKRIWGIGQTSLDNFFIPKNHFWLEGDNRSDSRDSRMYGPVEKKHICGKVAAIIRMNPLRIKSVLQ